ncbi:hypothetical protein, partial [Pseudomonas sp. MPR-R2A5]|uniref:hypothetical protein n=1 Tax=Pseudomonas sp. MPR-R2A5 TaxID=2070622 RepID=UPI001C481224
AGQRDGVAVGLVDVATAGTSLSPLRTATYVLLNDNLVGTMRRVIGFCSEASSSGGLTLGFGLVRQCYASGLTGDRWGMAAVRLS